MSAFYMRIITYAGNNHGCRDKAQMAPVDSLVVIFI